jgi:DNA processing protein
MIRLTDQQRLDWLRLARTEGVGPILFRALINRHGGAGAALQALPALAAKRGRAIVIPSPAQAEAELRRAEALGARLLGFGELEYPALLREIDAPPPVLAMRGLMGVLARPPVAIVGSRNASTVGRKLAANFAAHLGREGYTIVSGLARGVDAEAHRATLSTGTIGVLAGGLDQPYPPEHAGLIDEMVETGLVVSERPFGMAPRGRDFPRRNRIIAGLSRGVIVVEAARRSGSLITARYANEQGREVFAIPGSPLDPRAEGTNDLIREGATLVAHPRDVVDALGLRQGLPSRLPGLFREPDAPDEDDDLAFLPDEPDTDEIAAEEPSHPQRPLAIALHEALGVSPVEFDLLVRDLAVPAAELHAALLELELEGRIQRHPGNRFSRA